MSNTRKATSPGPLRQERFASAQEYERGLMGNLVAKRAALLDSAEDRELVWFLQWRSHQPGGLKKFASELLSKFPERIGSASLLAFGLKPSQNCTRAQVEAIRDEVPGHYPLRGEIEERDGLAALLPPRTARELEIAHDAAKLHPSSYPASVFFAECFNAAESGLEKQLQLLALDPAQPVEDGGTWYFPSLVSTVREVMACCAADLECKNVVTSLGAKVHAALDYAAESRRLVLVDGNARMGKSFAAKDWCQRRPGRARYVQLVSTSDDISFFRAIAKALGVSINLNSKALELRQRIEETLQGGDLVLVLDEAHYIWPNLIDSRALPARINWILTALVNYNVPVALITTPQFFRNQKALEERTRWTSEQLVGRIGHYDRLPDELPEKDLQAVATALAGAEDAKIVEMLVLYAESSAKYLAGIAAVVDRARYTARKDGRAKFTRKDIAEAIKFSVVPADTCLKAALQPVSNPSRRRAAKPFADRFQAPLQTPETAMQPAFSPREMRPPGTRATVLETQTELCEA